MSRLYYELIKDIPSSLPELDRDLLRCTGHNLVSLAARTTCLPVTIIHEEIKDQTAAVVPISSGEGIIPGFTGAVAAILEYIGLKAWVTGHPDVVGFGEAVKSGADILFAADDLEFLAINPRNRKVVENAWATANGFVQALAAAAEMRSDTLEGQEVLALGLGKVGTHAVKVFQELGSRTWVFDTDSTRLLACVDQHKDVQVVKDLKMAFQTIDYILDATPAVEIIDESMIRPTTIISCPGVPHGLTPAARAKIGTGFIHDKLPLGVAVMALESLYSNKEGTSMQGMLNR